jgi:hypothetical protein
MPKFISMEVDAKGIPIRHTYETKDGTRYSARYAAVAMAACDGRDGTATLREAMRLRREREKGGVADLKKARHMLDVLIEHEEKTSV